MTPIIDVGFLVFRSLTRRIYLSLCKRQCLNPKTRQYTGGPANTSFHFSKTELKELRSLEHHFKRKLGSVYERFADVPDDSVFQGRHHVYVEDEDAIYRVEGGKRDEPDVVQVLRPDWAGYEDFSIQRVRLSPTESMLAAAVKPHHKEEARCILVQLGHCATPNKPLLILDNVFSFEWATDDVLFYTSQEGLRCSQVFRVHLTSAGPHRTLVYEEKDPEFFVELSCSRDHSLLTINCSSKSSSEVWLIDSSSPLSQPTLVEHRQPGLLYHVEHSNNHLYILANTGLGHEYQLLKAPLSSPAMQNWQPVYSPEPGAVIKDMEMLREHCVFTVREPQGQLQLQILPLKAFNCGTRLQLPSWACAIEAERLSLEDRDAFSFLLSSPVHPPVRYLLYPTEQKPLFREHDPHHTTLPECYTTRLQATSKDGTTVPVTLFHRRALADLQESPLLVHVYGAYGLDLNMAFSPEKRLLLEDNWALAYCHVRGGGERGLAWHRAGRLCHKPKGAEDLAACIQALFQTGVSRPSLTALTARSAGAVLAGALCNQHPHVLRAVLLQAPFLDVLGAMQDPSLPLTLEERGEWGDPLADPQHRHSIESYCPCLNITPQLYPSMLITAYSEDKRVPIAGVLKYVERLRRAIQTHSSNLMSKAPVPVVMLDLQPGGDHFGPEAFDQSLSESARQLAFLYTVLQLDHQPSGPKRRETMK